MGSRARDQGAQEGKGRVMTYDYIPKVPDYYTPPSDYEVPDEYADYYSDLDEKSKREREQDDETEL